VQNLFDSTQEQGLFKMAQHVYVDEAIDHWHGKTANNINSEHNDSEIGFN
jgi:hypothetical protein